MPERNNADRGVERSLKEINWQALTQDRQFYPSPTSWDDEVLYFLFVDRFSDGKEYGGFHDNDGRPVEGPGPERTTPLFQIEEDAGTAQWESWFDAGRSWCGGTLAGLTGKIGYLRRLGITAVWLSPIFKQVTGSDDYHGYGIQNFLDVDPHFGGRADLKAFVAAAHEAGIRVILDIILNHAGDVFAYEGDRLYPYRPDYKYPVAGFRSRSGDPGSIPFGSVDLDHFPDAWPDGAVWPAEFQSAETWTRQGQIQNWDGFPDYLDGDFFSLKDIDHGPAPGDPELAWDVQRRIAEFQIAPALINLAQVYKFWIAYADIDGYRIDTVKHMEPGAVRYFANVIHEFAQSLGKERFYLIGEVTGGRAHAVNILNTTGLDAALGINDIPDKLEYLAKGWRHPGNPGTDDQEGYFDFFRNSLLDDKHTHQWYGRHVVTMFDDHDQVGVLHKYRFCGQDDGFRYLPLALGLNLTTSGIPCLCYGTEQAFNGADRRSGDDSFSDVFLRECMFGGPFGSLQSVNRHFFNEDHEIYRFIQAILELRSRHIALRRGRQYLRRVSESGEEGDFYYSQPVGGQLRWVVAWSRVFADREYLCAVNTDPGRPISVWVNIDKDLHPPGKELRCLLSTEPDQIGGQRVAEAIRGSSVSITVPAAGFVIYQ